MQAAIDDLAAQRVEIVGNELLELLFEEVGQDLGAGVVARVAELGLRLGAQEGLTDELASFHRARSRTAGSARGPDAFRAQNRCGARGIRARATRP